MAVDANNLEIEIGDMAVHGSSTSHRIFMVEVVQVKTRVKIRRFYRDHQGNLQVGSERWTEPHALILVEKFKEGALDPHRPRPVR